MDMGLDGKAVWITGATGAIGRAIALAFAREGARLAVSARRPDALDALVGEIGAAGAEAIAVPLDVTDAAAAKAAAATVRDRLGALDVLATTVAVPAFGPAVVMRECNVVHAHTVAALGKRRRSRGDGAATRRAGARAAAGQRWNSKTSSRARPGRPSL